MKNRSISAINKTINLLHDFTFFLPQKNLKIHKSNNNNSNKNVFLVLFSLLKNYCTATVRYQQANFWTDSI